MDPQPDPDRTADDAPADSGLNAGLAAAFGPAPRPPASALAGLRPGSGELRPLLLRDAAGADDAPVVRPYSDGLPESCAIGPRYQLFGEIARGGMGAVLRGRDADLGRELAVKVLLAEHANRADVARRFIEEAQVGAQLQHPGVVPVYDLGHFGDRPFFTMKLVQGRTLAALLAERTDPAADRPRFLGIVLQVCQAVAYAHAKGVIHRDLKPANVMVGRFGEVQVMDWGLAKVLPEGGVADDERAGRERSEAGAVVRPGRGTAGGAGADTQAGSLLGTPAYMPPEQARGAVDRLDRRADVFGLGAILCEVLTGRPPYRGVSAEEVRRKAAAGDLADAVARLGACGAEAELVALARACLAPEPGDRPRDAGAVAEALAAYLNGVQERLRRAEVARAEAVVRAAEERKRRRVQAALAASVLGLVLLGGGGGAWWWRQRVEAEQAMAIAEQAAAATLDEADGALGRGDWAGARAAAERAAGRLGDGGPAGPRERLGRIRADLAMVAKLEEIRLRQADMRDGHYDELSSVSAYAAAFAAHGLDVESSGQDEAGRRVAASAIRDQLVAALDDWAFFKRLQKDEAGWRHLLAVARRADPDEWRVRLRDAVAQGDRAELGRLAADPVVAAQPSPTALLLAKQFPPAEAVAVLRVAQRAHPGDFWLNHYLVSMLREVDPRSEDAVGFYRAALAVRPDSPGAHLNLGVALDDLKRPAEAEAAYRQAIKLKPDYAGAYSNLGNLLRVQGRLAEAEAACRRAIALQPGLAEAHYNLGNLLRQQNRPAGAEAAYRQAIELKPDLAEAHCNLGFALQEQGRYGEALPSFRRGHELGSRRPGWRYPSDKWVQEDERLADLGAKLSAVLRGAAEPAGAAERLGFATMCQDHKKRYAAAARFYAEAFAAEPELAAPYRYNAACCAALAAGGQGADAPAGDAERARLRQQALDWLRAELAALTWGLADGSPEAGPEVARRLRHWRQDADFAGVRGEEALAKLPDPERAAWRKLWADVADLLHKADPP